MTSTHYSKFSSDSVSFVSVDERTAIVDGQKVPYKTAKFAYDHENEDGQIVTGDLSFEMPEVKISYGLTLEKGYNLKGRFDFSRTDEDAMDCVASVNRTQTKGWVKKEDVDIEMDVGSCTATPKDEDTGVNVYSTASDETPLTVFKGTMNVVGKSPDKKFLSVVFGGHDGFFEKLRKCLASIVYSNRSKFGLVDKSEEEIAKMITDPVYIAKDKNTGRVMDRDPSVYFNVIYYAAKPATADKEARKESLARFEVPGMDEYLDLNVLQTKCITCVPTVKILHLTKSGSKLSMKMYVTGACVTDIDDIKKTEHKTVAYTKFSQNKELVEKLRKKMAKVKLETPKPKIEEPEPAPIETTSNEEPNVSPQPETTEEFNLENMLNSDAPTLDDIDLDM